MLLNAAGAAGQFLVVVGLVGLPIQFALALLVAMGRRISGAAAAAVPAILLGIGLYGVIAGLDGSIGAIGGSGDPAWTPWFALQDRARAMAPGVLGGFMALALSLPVAFGAAARALRSHVRRWWAVIFGVGVGTVAALGMLVVGALERTLDETVLPALALWLLTSATAVACAEAPSPKSPRVLLVATRVAAAAWTAGAMGLLVGAICLAHHGGAHALPDFSAPFSRVGALDAQATRAARTLWLVGPFVVVASVGLLPGFFLRSLRGIVPEVGVDAVIIAAAGALLLLGSGWSALRWGLLSHLAGAHSARVVEYRVGTDVPHVEPIPPRVLLALPERPRWVVMREAGGVEDSPVAGGLDDAARLVQRGDGVVFPPTMALDDFYFTLADAKVGNLSLVGCDDVPGGFWDVIEKDPLRAVGRCGAFPLRLRPDEQLRDPARLIVLRDNYVDMDGDVVEQAALPAFAGRAVLLRGQADATVADLTRLLTRLADASGVYLSWGVSLDGDSIPIGVDPQLDIRRPSPTGQDGAPAPAQ